MISASANHPINCGLATSSFLRTFEKRPVASRKFDIVASPVQRVTSGGSTTTISKDKNGGTSGPALKTYLRTAGAAYVTDYQISLSVREEGYFQGITLTSDSPGVLASPAASWVATYQSSGGCTLRATSEDGEVSLTRVSASSFSPATVENFQSWATGSLARHCTDQINSLIATKAQMNVFNQTSWFTQPDFVRNPNCWANGVDLSCASPWNNQQGSLLAGTLVSPRHVVFCDHASFYPAVGRTITFVAANGTVMTRTITASAKASIADIRVALLDSDVTGGVTFAKVLPTNWGDYLPGMDYLSMVPVMCLNQTERASIAMLRSLGMSFTNAYPSAYPSFYGEIILFDSGNPTFLVVNGQPVLIGVFTSGGAGAGSFVSFWTTAINAAMTSLGGGYQLTPVDLSAFTNYA